MKIMTRLIPVALSLMMFCVGGVWAAELTIPNVFVGGTPAVADDVNDNFDAVESAVQSIESSYTSFGHLNYGSVSVTTTWTALSTGGPHSFTKANDGTMIEVYVNSRFRGGTFSGASGISFTVRIDDTIEYDIGNEGSIISSGTEDFLSIIGVFQNLSAGSHTVSIYARANVGSSSGVVVDPGGFGGRIIVKEAW